MSNLTKPPFTFWIIAAIALLWNLMGVAAFYSDMTITAESLAAMTPEMQEYYQTNPLWNKLAYGIAVIAGSLGGIALLLRKVWAVPLFVLSLVAVLINNVYTYLFSGVGSSATGSQVALSAMVTLIAVFLWYYAKKAASRYWIG